MELPFFGVLSACSHGGLVKKGLHYFKLMTNDYQVFPDSEHYTCLIDLLGRAGLLDEAFIVLTSMSIKPDPSTFGAFIGACKVNGNVGLAKWAAEKLFTLEPNKPVNCTLMSNIYSTEGHWADVARVRQMMIEVQL
ncbi:putative pentatricopeptide [Rosa chinensis]|uniref:Putative pentatricopeptide n=1 Tax=Rosa chinensis TaxID=74649 RepID=A0A2P6SHQ1_ROSCH|nr:putative pentatricopeptide [Rosa chinensis]